LQGAEKNSPCDTFGMPSPRRVSAILLTGSVLLFYGPVGVVTSAQAGPTSVQAAPCPDNGAPPPVSDVANGVAVPPPGPPVGSLFYLTRFPEGVAWLLGPPGLTCNAQSGVGELMTLSYPGQSTPALSAVFGAGGSGPALALTCSYFTDARDALAQMQGLSFDPSQCALPGGIAVEPLATGAVGVMVPAGQDDPALPHSGGTNPTYAVVVDGSASPAGGAFEADCSLGADQLSICAASLKYFLNQQDGPAADQVSSLSWFMSPPPQKPSSYVAMGDSYSSGEGADWPPGQAAQEPGCDWQLYHDPAGLPANTDHLEHSHHFGVPRCFSPADKDRRGDTCHRAITAYPHVVIEALGNPRPKLRFVACSGDTLSDAIRGHGQQAGPNTRVGEASQLGALSGDTSLVTLTLGGNDLDFAGDARTCVTPSKNEYDCLNPDQPDKGSSATALLQTLGYNTTPGDKNDGKFSSTQKVGHGNADQTAPPQDLSPKSLPANLGKLIKKSNLLPNLHDRLILYYRTIHELAPKARILVLGYPRFFPTSTPAAAHFSSQEAQWINERIALADDVIHDAVVRSGVAQYVDGVYNALAGHELGTGDYDYSVDQAGHATCRTGEYINDVDLAQGSFGSPELLHPNPCGHQAEAQLVASAYLNPPSLPDAFHLPQLPPAGVIVGKDQHGHFSFGCHATFTATVDKSRQDEVASYKWFDSTGNERGTGNTLDMASAPNSFQLYLRTTGKNGQVRYSFFHGGIC
jgi:GDSL-like Lipase/Acylhydrolase family